MPLAFASLAGTLMGQSDPTFRSWNQPVAPFRIAGNLYYVGANEITSYLITTPAGHIVLDGGLPETAPQIEKNIEQLGFKLSDVKILLNSHAHFDHAGGLAELKEKTGAQLVVMAPDDALIARGGKGDFGFGDKLMFPAIRPERVIKDGDEVKVGDVTMVAHLTAGHTRGCTTWTTNIRDGDKMLAVVFIGSTTALDYKLVGQESYPGIARDFEKTFATLKGLPCDIFLASHGSFYHLTEKREQLARGVTTPFIDPAGYKTFVERAEKEFRDKLAAQSRAP